MLSSALCRHPGAYEENIPSMSPFVFLGITVKRPAPCRCLNGHVKEPDTYIICTTNMKVKHLKVHL